MRRWAWVVLVPMCVGLDVCRADADDEMSTALLNDPSGFVSTAKDFINRLNTSYETLWLVSDGTFSQGVSASLYNITSGNIPIASLRIGFGTNENLYAGPSLDLPGIARRYIPSTAKGFLSAGPLDWVWSVAGKYARVGIIGGYSWGDNEPIYGVTAGAALTF